MLQTFRMWHFHNKCEKQQQITLSLFFSWISEEAVDSSVSEFMTKSVIKVGPKETFRWFLSPALKLWRFKIPVLVGVIVIASGGGRESIGVLGGCRSWEDLASARSGEEFEIIGTGGLRLASFPDGRITGRTPTSSTIFEMANFWSRYFFWYCRRSFFSRSRSSFCEKKSS